MSKVFAQSVRDAILQVDPENGTKAHTIPQSARRTLLRNGFFEILDGEGPPVIILTKVGRFAQEILIELREAFAVCDRMKESGLATILTPIQHQGRAGAIGSHRRIGGARPGPTCGKLNTDSFAEFMASLNAAGKNRWKDPRYMGEGPARGAKPQAQENEDENSQR